MERMQTIARPTNTTNKSRRVRHIYGVESYNHKQKENVTVIELDNRTVVIKVYNAFQIRERKQRVDNTQIYFNQLLHGSRNRRRSKIEMISKLESYFESEINYYRELTEMLKDFKL